MKINRRGVEMIKRWESLRLDAYKCPAGKWTIGYGHTGADVYPGKRITEAEAEALLLRDVAAFERDVASLVAGVPCTEDQFSALVSFAFNVGSDIDDDTIPEGLGDSTLLRKFRAGDVQGAANEFRKWVYAGGKILPGLVKRREAERALFLWGGEV